MIYTCETCSYKTDSKQNYTGHLLTKKHLKNVEDKQNEILGRTCANCNGVFSTRSNYQKHIKNVCGKNNNVEHHANPFNDHRVVPVADMSKHIVLLEKKITKMKIEKHKDQYEKKLVEEKLEHEKKLIETKLEFEKRLSKEKDKMVVKSDTMHVEQANYLKGLVVQAGNLVSTSLSASSFLKNNYNTAPILSEIPDYKKLNHGPGNEDKPLEDVLMHNFKYKKLDDFVCQLLVGHYKKLNPREQSAWNSDPERKTYIVRSLVNNKPDWVTDKKGEKLKALAVDPLVRYLKTLIQKKLDEFMKLPESSSKLSKVEATASLIRALDDKQFGYSVISKMAPHLYLDEASRKASLMEPITTEEIEDQSIAVAEPLDVDKLNINEDIVNEMIEVMEQANIESDKNIEKPVTPPLAIEAPKEYDPFDFSDMIPEVPPKKEEPKYIDLDAEKDRLYKEKMKALKKNKKIKIIKTF